MQSIQIKKCVKCARIRHSRLEEVARITERYTENMGAHGILRSPMPEVRLIRHGTVTPRHSVLPELQEYGRGKIRVYPRLSPLDARTP